METIKTKDGKPLLKFKDITPENDWQINVKGLGNVLRLLLTVVLCLLAWLAWHFWN